MPRGQEPPRQDGDTVPEHHDMVLAGRTESGTEEWMCPTCGRRLLMRWPPRYESIVLDRGDETVVHAGAKGGALMRETEVTYGPSADLSDSEARWLRGNGIDWDGLAS